MRSTLLLVCAIGLSLLRAEAVVNLRSGEDRPVEHRAVLVLDGPATGSWTIEGGTILTWNTFGRVFSAKRFDAAEFKNWTAGRTRLGARQQLVFSQRLSFPAGNAPSRSRYIFRAIDADGRPARLTKEIVYGSSSVGTEPVEIPEGQPRFEVCLAPDQPLGVIRGHVPGLAWGFTIWLQETNGAAVQVDAIDWVARGAAGEVIDQGRLDAAAIEAASGRTPQVGPDNFLAVPAGAVKAEAGITATELVLTASGSSAAGPVRAMSRCELQPVEPRPANTLLRLPLQGDWRVAKGPGSPPFAGAVGYTWIFEKSDGQGNFCRGDGSRVEDHYAWGQVVYAPAAGQVADAIDIFADAKVAAPHGTFGGGTGENRVLLDHQNGEYSVLTGFQQHGLAVRNGMQVQAGQPLGRIGCSLPGFDRPGLRYKLVRVTEDGHETSLQALFTGWALLGGELPDGPCAPEADDRIRAQ
jgi:murein DD-endopeptidase MepM/ murein hydrolase activator NlpD